jgi:hypothetical protein
VRATVVTGIPSTVVMSLAARVRDTWTLIPVGPTRPRGTVTSIWPELGLRSHRSAADLWLNAAPARQARTAARYLPRFDTEACPTEYTPLFIG